MECEGYTDIRTSSEADIIAPKVCHPTTKSREQRVIRKRPNLRCYYHDRMENALEKWYKYLLVVDIYQVGGEYVFLHRFIPEHFLAFSTTPIAKIDFTINVEKRQVRSTPVQKESIMCY